MDTRAFLREHVAGRPMIVGGLLALVVGTSLGSYLKAGELFYERPAPQVIIEPEAAPTPIFYMMDADGKIPDYVIGTDSTAFEPLPLDRVAWEAPALTDSDGATDDWTSPTPPVTYQPLEPTIYNPPPSVSGDILAIAATSSAPTLEPLAEPSPAG